MKFSRALSGLAVTLALVLTVSGATLTPVPAQAGTEDAAIYYDELSQYGSWVDYEQYGPVWYPNQVEQDWRPYVNGRWVPAKQGYLFETEEPWGWATYHYGNWMPTDNYGWVWVPGRTWYPSTVTWRTSPETRRWTPPTSVGRPSRRLITCRRPTLAGTPPAATTPDSRS